MRIIAYQLRPMVSPDFIVELLRGKKVEILIILFIGFCGYLIAKNIGKGWIQPIKKDWT